MPTMPSTPRGRCATCVRMPQTFAPSIRMSLTHLMPARPARPGTASIASTTETAAIARRSIGVWTASGGGVSQSERWRLPSRAAQGRPRCPCRPRPAPARHSVPSGKAADARLNPTSRSNCERSADADAHRYGQWVADSTVVVWINWSPYNSRTSGRMSGAGAAEDHGMVVGRVSRSTNGMLSVKTRMDERAVGVGTVEGVGRKPFESREHPAKMRGDDGPCQPWRSARWWQGRNCRQRKG